MKIGRKGPVLCHVNDTHRPGSRRCGADHRLSGVGIAAPALVAGSAYDVTSAMPRAICCRIAASPAGDRGGLLAVRCASLPRGDQPSILFSGWSRFHMRAPRTDQKRRAWEFPTSWRLTRRYSSIPERFTYRRQSTLSPGEHLTRRHAPARLIGNTGPRQVNRAPARRRARPGSKLFALSSDRGRVRPARHRHFPG